MGLNFGMIYSNNTDVVKMDQSIAMLDVNELIQDTTVINDYKNHLIENYGESYEEILEKNAKATTDAEIIKKNYLLYCFHDW